MAHPFTFTVRDLEFTFQSGKFFVFGQEITLRDIVLFAIGKIEIQPQPTPEPTIVDVVIQVSGAEGFDDDNTDFDILREALKTAGLVETLADTGADFSVFAPTDAAFIELAQTLDPSVPDGDEAAALDAIVAVLTDLGDGDPVPLLTEILLYHVAPGGQTLAELQGTVTTVQGGDIEVRGVDLVDAEPDLANPAVIARDIEASNGTIQAIDRVLLPFDLDGNDQPNIVEIAGGSDDFNILVKALSTAGLVETVQGLEDITVFAPTDAAFTQLAVDLGFDGDTANEDAVFDFIAGALSDLAGGDPVPLLTNILLYHVSAGAKSAAAIDEIGTIDTLLDGATFDAAGGELTDNEPDIDNPSIVIPDIIAGNGTIQAIDRVLLPIDIPGNGPNIVDIATGSDDFNILVQALSTAGLVETIAGLNDITVFAPTDAAFTALAVDLGFDGDTTDEDAIFGFIAGALADLAGGDPVPLLTDILLYHVSPGAKTAAEVDAADTVTTLLDGATFGSEGTELVDNEPDLDNPNIVIPDIGAENGTIQAIDRVLIPLDIPGNTEGETIVGTRKSDHLIGTAGDDEIFGLKGNDRIEGGEGDDKIDGGKGRDLLAGGAGDDHLTGGRGRDYFDFRELDGDDTVTDYSRWDRLVFSKDEFENAHEVFAALEEVGHDVVITASTGTVTLEGVDQHDLNAHSFIFA